MWQHTINTSLLNFSGGTVPNAMLGYTGTPTSGNMYFSLSAASGTDVFGNTFPTGLAIQSGQVQGVSLVGTSMDSTSTLLGTSVQNAQVLTPSISGGTAASLVHTIGSSGGQVLGYGAQATSSVTFSTNGVSLWTVPTGITSVRVQCWGAGGGGDGAGGGVNGTGEGGPGGGAGEYAEEPNYPVSPGQVYQVVVGQGGSPGSLNYSGSDGTPTQFYLTGGSGPVVQANQGIANGGFFVGGPGGSGSTNTIHFDGGDGGSGNGGTGGSGGGSSGGPNSGGNQGSGPSGSTGGAGGAAVSGGGAGGGGGNNTANGSNGSGPGGGGGGGGYATTTSSKTLSYEATASASYYGADATSNHDLKRTSNGTIYQGGETASGGAANGTQKCLFAFPQSRIQSDWAGFTINSCTLWITNEHTWYNSGMSILIGTYSAATSPPSNWNGTGTTKVATATIAEGQRHAYGLGATVGKKFAAQASPTVYMIAFGPGPAFDLNYFGYFNGTPNNGNGPVLTIAGTSTGTTGGTGGNGADGKVILTFGSTSTQGLILSVSATTAVDSFGNPFGAGVQTFNGSGSTVATVDSNGVSSLGSGSIVAQMNSSGLTLFEIATPASAASAAVVYATTNGNAAVIDGGDGQSYSLGQRIMVLGSSTAIASNPGSTLFSPTISSRTYRIHGVFYCSISGAAQQLLIGVGLPGNNGGQLVCILSRAAALISTTNFGTNALTGIGGAASLAAGNTYVAVLYGILNNNATGTLAVTFAATNTNDITIAQNSYVELTPV